MIKFFRKIRQNLLSEGKTGKYFKYALGEIILVVIGILIAFQVSSWKENKQNLIKENTYIESFKKDLNLDIKELEFFNKEMSEDYYSLINISNRISSQNATIDTLISIYRNEYTLYFNPASNINNKTLESIIASGDFDLLDAELKDKLLNHNSIQAQRIKIINDNFNIHLQTLNIVTSKYPFKPAFDAFGKPLFQNRNGKLDKTFWGNIDEQDFIGHFNGLVNSKIQMENIIMGIRNQLLEDTRELLISLNEMYKNK